MDVVIRVPQCRDTYEQAYDWVTDGLDPKQGPEHSRDEIIELAAEKVLEAVPMIRDWLKAELELTVGDYRAVVEEQWPARIAVLLALEELENWTDLVRLDMLVSLTDLIHARYRYEREEDDDDLI